jgi:hypothetical protein
MRTKVKNDIKETIQKVTPEDPSTHPLDFNLLTFHVFSGFLKTFKRRIKRSGTTDEHVVVNENVTVRATAGAYDDACAAFSYLFVECDMDKNSTEVSKNLWHKIGLYKKGCHNTSARERQALGLHTSEGKDPMPIAALIYLCEILHNSKDREDVAALLLLLIDWNLISFADNVVNAHVDLCGISMMPYCAMLVLQRVIKRELNTDNPFHIYSVPEKPMICLVLAFACYLI